MSKVETENQKPAGTLLMAATSLGDTNDIPPRSLNALKNSIDTDLLVFEEDRPARSFLKAAGVHKDYRRYSEHDQKDTLDAAAKTLRKGGTVIYMSDQGTPGIADPGRDLVQRALDMKAKIKVIPGPSSLTAAISACPFDCFHFTFLGMPPRQTIERNKEMQKAAQLEHPVIYFDAPYRMKQLLSGAEKAFGPKRRAMLAMEIGNEGEDYWVAPLSELCTRVESLSEKVNFVLIIDGR